MALRTAIIGMGKMGRIRKKELDKHEGFEVVALCDIDENIAKEFPNLYFSKQWEDVLKQELDAVAVCTFNNIIPDIVITSLNKGLHVFSEKPPGRSVEDVERMKHAYQKSKNCVLKFGFNHRFHYGVMEAKAIVDSKKYGDIVWARGVYGKAGGLYFENCWRSDQELAGGGILLDQGIHMLDLLRYFLGDFEEVKSYVDNLVWQNIPFEDNAFALLKTKDNKVAMAHSSATQWKHKFLLELFMEKGYVIINGLVTGSRSYGEESVTYAKRQFEDEATFMGRPREQTIYFDRDESWRLEIEEFYDCITGKKENVTGNIDDALKVMQLIESIYLDSSKKCKI